MKSKIAFKKSIYLVLFIGLLLSTVFLVVLGFLFIKTNLVPTIICFVFACLTIASSIVILSLYVQTPIPESTNEAISIADQTIEKSNIVQSKSHFDYEKDHQENNFIKGDLFENQVFEELRKAFPEDKHTYYRKLRIFKKNFKSDIDILLVCNKGVFVFEAKNWEATITDFDQEKVIVRYEKSGNKHEKYNPILQNNDHIKQLMNKTGFTKKKYYYNVVVLPETAQFSSYKRSKYYSDKHIIVEDIRYLIDDWLDRYINKSTYIRLDDTEMKLFIEGLEKYSKEVSNISETKVLDSQKS